MVPGFCRKEFLIMLSNACLKSIKQTYMGSLPSQQQLIFTFIFCTAISVDFPRMKFNLFNGIKF